MLHYTAIGVKSSALVHLYKQCEIIQTTMRNNDFMREPWSSGRRQEDESRRKRDPEAVGCKVFAAGLTVRPGCVVEFLADPQEGPGTGREGQGGVGLPAGCPHEYVLCRQGPEAADKDVAALVGRNPRVRRGGRGVGGGRAVPERERNLRRGEVGGGCRRRGRARLGRGASQRENEEKGTEPPASPPQP